MMHLCIQKLYLATDFVTAFVGRKLVTSIKSMHRLFHPSTVTARWIAGVSQEYHRRKVNNYHTMEDGFNVKSTHGLLTSTDIQQVVLLVEVEL